jgi:hypothetical protein
LQHIDTAIFLESYRTGFLFVFHISGFLVQLNTTDGGKNCLWLLPGQIEELPPLLYGNSSFIYAVSSSRTQGGAHSSRAAVR